MGRIVVQFWDCKHCGTKAIRGSERDCPNCGNARDEDIVFYMDPQRPQYISTEEAKKVTKKPDWICPFCNNLNSDNVTNCTSCGSLRTSENETYSNFNHIYFTPNGIKRSSEDKFDEIVKNDMSSTSYRSTENNIDSISENIAQSSSRASYQQKKETVNNHSDYLRKKSYTHKKYSKSSNSLFNFFYDNRKGILITLAIIALVAGLIFLFMPRYYDVSIEQFSWERNIYIEKYQTVNESDWNLPVGGRLHYTRQELSHYEQVLDHYETKTRTVSRQRISGYEEYVVGYRDLGNGYAEEVTSSRPVYETYYETETYQDPVYRSEPVYRTKYYYEIDKWLPERTVTTKQNDHSPYWGEPNLSKVERTSGKTEVYRITVYLADKDETNTYTISYDQWKDLSLGEETKIKVTLGQAEIVEE